MFATSLRLATVTDYNISWGNFDASNVGFFDQRSLEVMCDTLSMLHVYNMLGKECSQNLQKFESLVICKTRIAKMLDL